MKGFYKIAMVSLALAFAACDDSSSASNGNGADSCTDDANSGDASQSVALCPETFEEGTTCDARDGKIYKVATFGAQTWMIQNLNYNSSSCSVKNQSWCYEDNEANCQQYGRLYTWTAAMGLDKSYQTQYANLSGTKRGICPDGFHMPSDAEWQALYDYLDANGNESEFAVTLSGEKSFGGFSGLNQKAFFWTADEDHNDEPLGGPTNVIVWTYASFFGGGSLMKDSGLSVRCVMD